MHASDTLNFVGVAAPRSGTTWLSQCLAEHPDVCFADRKEVAFFNRPHNLNQGTGKYREHFRQCQTGTRWGEYTPDYFLDARIATQLLALNPEIKIIVAVREPVTRAISHARLIKQRHNLSLSLEEIIFSDRYRVLDCSRYAAFLIPFLQPFRPEQVVILQSETFTTHPDTTIEKLYRFLDLEETTFTPPSLYTPTNTIAQNHFYLTKIESSYANRYKYQNKTLINLLESKPYQYVRALNTYTKKKTEPAEELRVKKKIVRALERDTTTFINAFTEHIDPHIWQLKTD